MLKDIKDPEGEKNKREVKKKVRYNLQKYA